MLTKLQIYDPAIYSPYFDIGLLMLISFIYLLPIYKDCWAEENFGAMENVLNKY